MATTEDAARLILTSTTEGLAEAGGEIASPERGLRERKEDDDRDAVSSVESSDTSREFARELGPQRTVVSRAEDALAKDGPAREAATAIAGASWDTVADSAQAAEQPGRGGGPDLAGLLASLAAVCDRLGPALASFVASLGSDAPGRRADEVGPPGGRADGPGAAIPPAPEVPGARPPSQRRRRRRRR